MAFTRKQSREKSKYTFVKSEYVPSEADSTVAHWGPATSQAPKRRNRRTEPCTPGGTDWQNLPDGPLWRIFELLFADKEAKADVSWLATTAWQKTSAWHQAHSKLASAVAQCSSGLHSVAGSFSGSHTGGHCGFKAREVSQGAHPWHMPISCIDLVRIGDCLKCSAKQKAPFVAAASLVRSCVVCAGHHLPKMMLQRWSGAQPQQPPVQLSVDQPSQRPMVSILFLPTLATDS